MKTNRNKLKEAVAVVALFLLAVSVSPAQDSSRDREQQPDRVIKIIGVRPGMVVGDVGAGEGYFTFKLSPVVGETGHVFANEINWRSLQIIKKKAEEEGITNTTTILGKAQDPLFPERSLDLALMVHVIHNIDRPEIYFKNLKADLKKDGILAIVQWDPEKMGEVGGTDNLPTKDDVIRIVSSAGFVLFQEENFLEKETILLFRPMDKNIPAGEINQGVK